MDENVVQFPKRHVIFTEAQRREIEGRITPYTKEPDQVVNHVEDALCRSLVSACKDLAVVLADKAAKTIVRFFSEESGKPRCG